MKDNLLNVLTVLIIDVILIIGLLLMFSGCKVRDFKYKETNQTNEQVDYSRIENMFSEQDKKIDFRFTNQTNIWEDWLQNFNKQSETSEKTYNPDGTLASEKITKENTTIDSKKSTVTEQNTEVTLTASEVSIIVEEVVSKLLSEYQNNNTVTEQLKEKPVKNFWYVWLIGGIVLGFVGKIYLGPWLSKIWSFIKKIF